MVQKNTNFDIQRDMQELAEKSIHHARQVFDNLISATQQAMSTLQMHEASQRDAQKVGELAIRFTERNILSSFEFTQRLLQAKDAAQMTTLHSDYVQSQIAALTEQTRELSAYATKMTGHTL